MKAILKAFDDSDPLLASGLRIKGDKYFVIRADDKVIQGRKVHSPSPPPLLLNTPDIACFFFSSLFRLGDARG